MHYALLKASPEVLGQSQAAELRSGMLGLRLVL